MATLTMLVKAIMVVVLRRRRGEKKRGRRETVQNCKCIDKSFWMCSAR
jgi:hypothetical protein